jgi:ribosomal protein S18 acetylase RimI-like enzyme
MKIVDLNKNHIHLLVELEMACIKDQFVSLSSYEWYETINNGAMVWGIFEENKLIALTSITFYDYNGGQTDLTSAYRAVLTNSVVHPTYRGRGYQSMLIRHRIEFLLKNTTVKEINSLVKKSNIYSIHNLENEGFVYKGKYSGPEEADGYAYAGTRNLFYWKLKNFFKSL